MKILALSASPRRNGNTERLLDRVIDGLESRGAVVEKIRTHDQDVFPCEGCGFCQREGRCRIEDGFAPIREKLIGCDGVVFASPLYFMNVPARGKALIDRCQSFWVARHRLGIDLFGNRMRFGVLTACSGAGYGPGGTDIFRGIEDTMTFFFDALGLRKEKSLLVRRVDEPGDILAYPDIIAAAYALGERLAQFA